MAETIACEVDVRRDGHGVIPLQIERQLGFGSVVGLEDEELADPHELERQVMISEWSPILQLPVRSRNGWGWPTIDEDGDLDWGAFGTADFARLRGTFDKALYKADRLQEELRHQVIMLETTGGHIPMASRLRILDEGRRELLDPDEVEDMNEWFFARRYLRVKRLRNEIRELRRCSWERRRGSQ